MLRGKLPYEPPRIRRLGTVDQFAFDAIVEAFQRLTAAGTRITLFRLREEARKDLNLIAVSDETIAKAAERFTQTPFFKARG